jgi:hypothetical protein
MKKILFLAFAFLMVSAIFARAGNPIPSFDYQLKKTASFQEGIQGPNNNSFSDERRDMNVSNDGSGGNGHGIGRHSVIIFVYRLDGSKMKGPYFVDPGETVTVPIDGQPWGVYAYSPFPSIISVWIGGNL